MNKISRKFRVETKHIVQKKDEYEGSFDVSQLRYKMKPHETPLRKWNFSDIEPKKTVYLLLCHALGLYGFYRFVMGQICFKTFMLGFFMYILGGLGITAGCHRLWSHQSYEATPSLEIFLVFLNTIANQGSIYHWSRDHIVHHKFSETVADPHDARRGFFFSHMGWLFVQKQPEVCLAGKQFKLTWLKKNRYVMFQHGNYPLLAVICCFMMPYFIASLWDDGLNGLLWAGFFRYIFTLHGTWTVNSLAHLKGERPYDTEISPSESLPTAIWSMGEGWHNFHHTFPSDYACSEFGIHRQYNPTKCFIDICFNLGLAKNLKRFNNDGKKSQ